MSEILGRPVIYKLKKYDLSNSMDNTITISVVPSKKAPLAFVRKYLDVHQNILSLYSIQQAVGD
jgi:hypothetical protein